MESPKIHRTKKAMRGDNVHPQEHFNSPPDRGEHEHRKVHPEHRKVPHKPKKRSLKRRFFVNVFALIVILTFVRFASHSVVGFENLTIDLYQRWYADTISDLAFKAGFEKPIPLPKDFTIKRGLISKMKSLRMSPGIYPILRGMVRRESIDNPYAESKAGAKGYGQLMPATTVKCGMTDPKEAFNGPKNIDCTVWYFNEILRENNGDIIPTMQAYNAGQKNIDKSEENRTYVRDVFKAMFTLPADELIWED